MFPNKTTAIRYIKDNILYKSYNAQFKYPIYVQNKNTSEVLILKNDIGWGCMYRCAQMLLSTALYHVTRNKKIFEEFVDTPEHVYSIHSLLKSGEEFGAQPGKWCGSFVISHTIRKVLENTDIGVYVAPCHVLNRTELLTRESKGSILILVTTKAGKDKVFETYYESIQTLIRYPKCIGCLGGKGRSAYFIIGGFGKSSLVYLDPHHIRFSQSIQKHDIYPSIMKVGSLSPTLTFAFMCESVDEIEQLCDFIDLVPKCPVFTETVVHGMMETI